MWDQDETGQRLEKGIQLIKVSDKAENSKSGGDLDSAGKWSLVNVSLVLFSTQISAGNGTWSRGSLVLREALMFLGNFTSLASAGL